MSRIDEINAILDELGPSATYDEVELALRDYPQRELISVLADRAAGGGGSAIAMSKVTITHDQLLTLHSTGVEIVPAPGAGKAVDFLRMMLSARIVADNREYTNISATAYLFVTRGGADIAYLFDGTYLGVDPVTELLGTTSSDGIGGNTVIWGPWYDVGTHDQGSQPVVEQRGGEIDNAALTLKLQNPGSGALQGGDPLNSLVVSTLYATFDIE